MQYIALITGDQTSLGVSELKSLVALSEGQIDKIENRVVFFRAKSIEEIVRRVTFTKYIAKLFPNPSREKRYKIIEKILDDSESRIKEVAKHIPGKVDLENPEDIYLLLTNSDGFVMGELIYERDVSEIVRSFKRRPFNHPSSINPLLARAMINISGVKTGGTIIDPFAGTGTFLSEAQRMGIKAIGIDLSVKMVNGVIENMKYYGFNDYTVRPGDFSQIGEYNFDAIVTDPPYGRGSKVFSETRTRLYQDLFSIIIRGNYHYSMALPNREIYELANEYLSPILAAEIFVHRSLTRYIITDNPSIGLGLVNLVDLDDDE